MSCALITGITGQDGSYLAEFQLAQGYEVHGIKRRASSFNTERVDPLLADADLAGGRLHLHYGDLTDPSSLLRLVSEIRPDEIYNLGAQSHVKVSFEMPEYTADVVAAGALRLLEAVRSAGLHCRYYQASSSEMFGSTPPPQSEESPFRPVSPYACGKLFAHTLTAMYRQAYGMHGSCGILFNHESPRRGPTFVTRKITRAVARIKYGIERELPLGNLEARRDWGYAPDYVRAMWLMLQQDRPGDYVIGTGESHRVAEFVELAFAHADLDWREFVKLDRHQYRPLEVESLRADPSKALRDLGWEPTVTFRELVALMVTADMQEIETKLNGGLRAIELHGAAV